MGSVRLLLVLVSIAGCGRLAFDPLGDTSGDGGVSGDGRTADGGATNAMFITGGSALQAAPTTTMNTLIDAIPDPAAVIVIAVHCRNTAASVISVTDAQGNLYGEVAGVVRIGNESQALYVAPVAQTTGMMMMTVTLDTASPMFLKYGAYGGIDQTSPVMTTAGQAGVGTTADTGPLAVDAPAILVAAAASSAPSASPGPDFSRRTVSGGGVLEDREVVAGTYTATAGLSASGDWTIQAVALRAR